MLILIRVNLMRKIKNILILIIIFFIINFVSLNKGQVDSSLVWPVISNKISSNFGYRTLGNLHFHNGVDIPLPPGTDIHSISSGIVEFTNFYGAYGYTIVIKHSDSLKSMYCHMDQNFKVKEGEFINKNTLIGYVGNAILPSNSKVFYLYNGKKCNGMTTGPHLHFSIIKEGKFIDPLLLEYKKEL